MFSKFHSCICNRSIFFAHSPMNFCFLRIFLHSPLSWICLATKGPHIWVSRAAMANVRSCICVGLTVTSKLVTLTDATFSTLSKLSFALYTTKMDHQILVDLNLRKRKSRKFVLYRIWKKLLVNASFKKKFLFSNQQKNQDWLLKP